MHKGELSARETHTGIPCFAGWLLRGTELTAASRTELPAGRQGAG